MTETGTPDESESEEYRLTGTTEPVHRPNSKHPLTGRSDNMRSSVGDRRRIEQLEYRLGHVICGHRSSVTGAYCTNEPIEGEMRCEQHRSRVIQKPTVENPKYSMTSHIFQRCQLCRLKDCSWRNEQSGGSECAVERDIYETLIDEAKKLDKYGEATHHMFEQLVWGRVLLYRAMAQIAAEGLLVQEVTGFANSNGDIAPIVNDREHPVLKHIARLQQMDKQVCDALELTPAARTRKGESESGKDAQSSIANLLKLSFQRFKAGESNSTE